MPFVKGDVRINRKGRPKGFDGWRALCKQILNEVATNKQGEPIIVDGHLVTNAEMIARIWASDRKLQQAIIEGAYGKVPQQVDLTVKKPVEFIVKYVDKKSEGGDDGE